MIYDYSNYINYINKLLTTLPKGGRGFKTEVAEALNCKTSFISLVFAGTADFSLEQGHALNKLLKHSETESDYFLLLIQYARAATKDLKEYFKNKITSAQNEHLRLKNRFAMKSIEKKEDEFKYFSSADYGLIHILTTISEFQTKDAMLRKLRIDANRLEKILNYLVGLGLVQIEKDRYVPGVHRMHLPDDASIISTHHTNWRVQAIKDCQSPSPEDLHYSSVVSIHRHDFQKLKALLVKSIEDFRGIVKESDSQVACSFCCDFYEIK